MILQPPEGGKQVYHDKSVMGVNPLFLDRILHFA